MTRLIALCLATLLLTGCTFGSKQPPVYIDKPVYIHPRIPNELLTPCTPKPPLANDAYLRLTIKEREQYMTRYAIDALHLLSDCNRRLKAIEVILKQSAAIEKKHSAPGE